METLQRNKVNILFLKEEAEEDTTYLRALVHLIIIFEFVVYCHGDSYLVVNLNTAVDRII